MEDFSEWVEESMYENSIFFMIAVVLCILIMIVVFFVSAILTHGATLILPFVYIAYKYFNRNK